MSDCVCVACSLGGSWHTHTSGDLLRGVRCCKRPLESLREEDLECLPDASQTSMTARTSGIGWTAHTLVSVLCLLLSTVALVFSMVVADVHEDFCHESTPCLPTFAKIELLVLHAEPQFGGNTINPIGVILWLVHGLGILAMSLF